jgi:hypothetical protein
MPEITFGLESYTSRSLPLSAQRMINAFFERQPQGAKSQTPIFGAPGLTEFTELPELPIRNMWDWAGILYVVAGQGLYRVNEVGGFTLLGSGILGDGFVSMSANSTQLMVVNGVSGWLVDDADNFQEITNGNFFSASTIQYFDNYFVFDRRGTNEFFLSAIADGTSYNALDFASAEALPDILLATMENLQLLFLFGQKHIEMWFDAGSADFPFQRYAGGVIEFGLAGPYALVKQDGAIFFLGSDHVFYRMQGNVPIRVSNHGIENAFQNYTDAQFSGAVCFTYTLQGHKMVHINFPDVPASWVFDISTNMWHEKDSVDVNGASYKRWRGSCAVEVYGKVLIGNFLNGKIFTLDWNNYTEDGFTMPFDIYSSTLQADKRRLFIGRFELDMETGVAPPTGQGSAPFALLRWSRDGAKTWSKVQPPRSTGKIGEYFRRMRWMALGSAYQWNFRLTITDPVKRVLIATHLDAVEGMP